MEALVASFGLDWRIFFSEIVNFLILLAIIYWVIKKYVSPILEKRRNLIAHGVENAEKAEKVLADAEEEKENTIIAAQDEASGIIKASVEKAKKREDEIVEAANVKGSELIESARAKGQQQKESIIESSKDDIAKMIVLGAEKILAQK